MQRFPQCHLRFQTLLLRCERTQQWRSATASVRLGALFFALVNRFPYLCMSRGPRSIIADGSLGIEVEANSEHVGCGSVHMCQRCTRVGEHSRPTAFAVCVWFLARFLKGRCACLSWIVPCALCVLTLGLVMAPRNLRQRSSFGLPDEYRLQRSCFSVWHSSISAASLTI